MSHGCCIVLAQCSTWNIFQFKVRLVYAVRVLLRWVICEHRFFNVVVDSTLLCYTFDWVYLLQRSTWNVGKHKARPKGAALVSVIK